MKNITDQISKITVLAMLMSLFLIQGCGKEFKLPLPTSILNRKEEPQKAPVPPEELPPESPVPESAQQALRKDVLEKSLTLDSEKDYQKHPGKEAPAEQVPEPPFAKDESISEIAPAEPMEPVEQPPVIRTFQPNLRQVEKRVAYFQSVLADWNKLAGKYIWLDMAADWPNGWHECVQQLEYLLFGYSKVREALLPGEGEAAVQYTLNPYDIFLRDIAYQQSQCKEIYETSNNHISSRMQQYTKLSALRAENLIRYHISKHHYKEAIQVYENLQSLLPAEEINFAVKELYGDALQRAGRLEDAAAFWEAILLEEEPGRSQVQGRNWLAVKVRYADLLLATGQLAKAGEQYAELEELFLPLERTSSWVAGQIYLLNEDLDNEQLFARYQDVLTAYLSSEENSIPRAIPDGIRELEEKYGPSALLSSAREIGRLAEERQRRWIDTQIARIEEYLQEREAEAAEMVLQQFAGLDIPSDLSGRIKELGTQVSEVKSQEQELLRQQRRDRLEQQWQSASDYFKKGRYDEAITVYERLLQGQYARQASQKLRQAQNLAAAEHRRQAADLFVKAQKSFDPEQRERYILNSYAILQTIIDRYPLADILDRVKQNMDSLKQQFPQLLGAEKQSSEPFSLDNRWE